MAASSTNDTGAGGSLHTDVVVSKVKAYCDDLVRQGLGVFAEVIEEMARQDAKWGIQDHPDGTGPGVGAWGRFGAWEDQARDARRACQHAAAKGQVTWRHILTEEVYEAFAERDPAKLRAELVQVEAVCAQWRMAIDRRLVPGE